MVVLLYKTILMEILFIQQLILGGASDNAIDLGYNNGLGKALPWWRCGNIYGTVAANKLDDYEEDTFTAGLAGGGSGCYKHWSIY